MDRKKLKTLIKEQDTCQWKEELETKISLRWYKEGKPYIGYDECYRNYKNSEYLAKARTNTLQLEEHLGRCKYNYDKICKLCAIEEEDLEHFMVKCPKLICHRDREIWEVYKKLHTKKQTENILQRNKEYGRIGKAIRKMWLLRKFS